MMELFGLPGPHDVPFAGPLVVGAGLGFLIAFVVLKLLDRFIPELPNEPRA